MSTSAHTHWPDAKEAPNMSHLATKPPPGGRPMSERPLRPSVRNVIGIARAAPANSAILSCPSAS
jgi:hypothetical protein